MTIQNSSGLMLGNGGSCLPLTPGEEKQIVEDLKNESELNLKEGNLYYVISARWYRSWERYVGCDEVSAGTLSFDSQHLNRVSSTMVKRPGPIDNSDIVVNGNGGEDDNPEIQRNLEEGQDYVLVPQQVWEKLFNWYKGGPALPRKMICEGIQSEKRVEVYPICLKVIDSRDKTQSVIRLSKKASIRELYERICALKGIKKEKARIWDYFNNEKPSVPLDVSDQTLEDAMLEMDQDWMLRVRLEVLLEAFLASKSDSLNEKEYLDDIQEAPWFFYEIPREILLEVKTNDGYGMGMESTGSELALVPLEPSRSSVTIAGGPATSNGHSTSSRSNLHQSSSFGSALADIGDRHDSSTSVKKVERGGLAGLQNLGNTCFMNSAIQCLVHTPRLVEYFLQDYSEEINTENPLGMHGELALAFGELLRKLWSSGRTAVAPRAFKGKLARFAPQFSGYNQHDSQELLAFLLDGLHEDLNRVKQKPYIEMKDSDGHPDEEVANECWKNHKARNDSLIVDLFQGQYKSTLVCPVCSKISITFDPFMYLTLPLPSTATRIMTVTVFYADGSGLPMPFTVTVMKHGCCKDLIQALGTACCLKSDERLLLAEVYNHHVFKYFENPAESLTSIKDDEHIVAYRFDRKGASKFKLEIVHRWPEKSTSDYLKGGEKKLFGTPLVTYLDENRLNGVDIDETVSRLLSPLRRTYSSVKAHRGKENGFVSEANCEPSNSCNLLMESVEGDDASINALSFQLFLTDSRITNLKPLQKDSTIKPGQLVKVVLDWSDELHGIYDASYLKDLPEVHKTGFTVKKTRQEAISLFSCLDAFLTEEPLGPDDMWYCPRCKEHRQATKKLDLWKLPDILVFHLKRFSYSRYMKNKLDTFVSFPVHNLDLSKYMKRETGESCVYELYAISNHYGGLGGGHYTAYAKLIDENRWYHFDDSHVSPVGESEIKTSAAYVLFYRRVKGESSGGVGETSQAHSC